MIRVTSQAAEELKSIRDGALQCGGEHTCGDHDCSQQACMGHSHLGQECADHDCGHHGHSGGDPVLRLIPVEDGRVGLVLDICRDGDQSVKHDDETLLVVGPELADAIADLVFDCVDTPQGRCLTLSNQE